MNGGDGSLWRHGDFLKLWGSQSVSQVGTQVSFLAIPLVAAVTLDASAIQMGMLAAAETMPFLLFGLFAGVLVDRVRRRPILIWSDIGRALLMAMIPLAWWFHLLSMVLLMSIAFLVGVLNVLFDVSYQSYLPSVVQRKQLVDGNSKLETSRAGAQIAGPGLAGGLIHLLGAPVAVILDAASFLVSGVLLALIRSPEAEIAQPDTRPSIVGDIREGIAYIARHPLLRPIAGCTGTLNFFSGMGFAILVLFATRELDLSAGALGVIFAGGSVGFLVGAMLAGRIANHIGIGSTIVAGAVLSGLGLILLPLAGGPKVVVAALFITGIAVSGVGAAIYNITQVSLRQSITSDRMLGRMNATMRFLVWGTLPLGSLAGGFIGEAIGLRQTLALAAIGSMFACLWPLLSCVRRLDSYPVDPAIEPAVPAVVAG